MKNIVKALALTATAAALLTPLSASAMGSAPTNYPEYDGSGICTKEYDPVPYVNKDGKTITAPNPCVAAKWKAQGV